MLFANVCGPPRCLSSASSVFDHTLAAPSFLHWTKHPLHRVFCIMFHCSTHVLGCLSLLLPKGSLRLPIIAHCLPNLGQSWPHSGHVRFGPSSPETVPVLADFEPMLAKSGQFRLGGGRFGSKLVYDRAPLGRIRTLFDRVRVKFGRCRIDPLSTTKDMAGSGFAELGFGRINLFHATEPDFVVRAMEAVHVRPNPSVVLRPNPTRLLGDPPFNLQIDLPGPSCRRHEQSLPQANVN